MTPPDKLPLFAFMSRFPISGKPRLGQMGLSKDKEGLVHPCWYYSVNQRGRHVAHELKSALTKKSGWDLKFPDSDQFWQARAIHTTRNSPDWHLSTESEGEITSLRGERDHTLIIIWHESSFMR